MSSKKLKPMKITNKDVIQSYLLTSARYNFNIYEKRVLFRLVELCQAQLENKKLDSTFTISQDLFGLLHIRMPISKFLRNKNDKNHTRVKAALTSLNNKPFEYENNEIWKIIRIIELPVLFRYGEYVEFTIQKEIYEAILDFSKGFRKYELDTAMRFESIYSMRFYELFSGKKEPISYSIEELKTMFHLVDKYSRVPDLIRRVIDPAKKELNKFSPYSFTYQTLNKGRKITGIKFYPIYLPKNRDQKLEEIELSKKVSNSWFLDRGTINYLKNEYFFSQLEIKNNLVLFKQAAEQLDFLLFLSKMKRKCSDKANPKGYLINAIKKELKTAKIKANKKQLL